MKQLLVVLMFCSLLTVTGQTFREFDNFASDEYVGGLSDVKIVREINGGTIFRVKYSSDCTYEMQGAFEYACKIVEEYLPPCLPITITVKWDTFRGSSSKNMLSKVSIRGFEDFSNITIGTTSYMPHIKHILLKEYETWVNSTFYDSIPNTSFLYDSNHPDITISYNKKFKSEFSYSLDTDCGNLYDFISLAIRDIVRGLGFVSNFTYDAENQTLLYPSERLNWLEIAIAETLGRNISDSERLFNATRGSLLLSFGTNAYTPIALYAPESYEKGISLNYFIPDSIYAISKVLSYNFGRGTVCRDLNDKHANRIFRSFLGWKEDIIVSSSASEFSQSGNSSLVLPFNGNIQFDDNRRNISTKNGAISQCEKPISKSNSSDDEIGEYINQFHRYYSPNANEQWEEGATISLLKKDGTWDVVYHTINTYIGAVHSFSDWKLSFPPSEYARTCDGYIRARITYALPTTHSSSLDYDTRYFVIDYLPQTVEIQLAETDALMIKTNMTNSTRRVRIYLKNIEGLTRVVAEKKRSGFRLPTKIEITDFKKGYFDAEIENNVTNTFTVIGYNDNGSSRSLPIEIKAITNSFRPYILIQQNSTLRLIPAVDSPNKLKEYEIIPMNQLSAFRLRKPMESIIDISALPSGYYVLRCFDDSLNEYNYKFIKK